MSDNVENYTHMKKSKYLENSANINLVENRGTKQKLIFEADKLKNDSKESDNISNNNSTKKVSINNTKNIYCKKRANSFYDTEKPIVHYNNDIKLSKKLIINKSYNNNDRKNSYKKPSNSINNKVMKKPINNSRNQKIIYNNSPSNKYGNKIKLRKRIIYNLKSNDSKCKTCINDIDFSHFNEKHNKTYFNTLFNNDRSINKSIEKNYFSCSQNLESKDSNNLKKVNIINIDLSSNHNEDIKSKFIIEAGKEFDFNNSNKNFYIKKSKNPFHPKNRFINLNNDYSSNTKCEEIVKNYETNYEDCNSMINNSQKKFQQPIKIYNDNTTINFADSYNFNQYFNTIISNKNINKNKSNNINYNNYNSSSKKTKIYSNYRYNLSPSYSPTSHLYNKNKDKNKYFNTQLNSNKKSNDILNNNSNKFLDKFTNGKLIEEINDLQEEMNTNLNMNPSNSKSKKYNTLKNFFEKLLRILNNYFYNNDLSVLFNFLQKLLIGYHEVVIAFSSENRKLKELNYKLTEQYQKIDKNLIECNKGIKEKQKKIEVLENKICSLVNNMKGKNNIIINNKSKEINLYRSINFSSINNKNKLKEYSSDNDEMSFKKSDDKQNNKIKKINAKNLDDLDALYFFDKIEMKPQRSFSGGKNIPFLPINIKKNNNI